MMGDAYTHIYAYLNTHTCICKHIDTQKHNHHQALLNSLMAAGTKEHLKRFVLHLGNMNLWLKVLLICHSSAWRGWEGLPMMDLNLSLILLSTTTSSLDHPLLVPQQSWPSSPAC